MPESSEIVKAKDCPGGMHAHTGYTECHPLDKPHRPGTSADLYHRQMGIANSWYERHGTTQDDYDKEHPKDDGKDRTEDNTSDDTSSPSDDSNDYSKVEFKGIMKWDCNKELKSLMPKEYDRVEKAQRKLDSLRYSNKTNVQIYRAVMGEYFKGQKARARAGDGMMFGEGVLDDTDIEMFLSPVNINKMPKDIFLSFMDESLKSIRECPFGAYAFQNMTASDKQDCEIMHYCWSEGKAGRPGFHFNMKYFKGRKLRNEPDRVINAKGEETTWGFHFAGERTYADCINHEYGHSLDFMISALQEISSKNQMNPDSKREITRNDLKDLLNEYRTDSSDWNSRFVYLSEVGHYRINLKDAPDKKFLLDNNLVGSTQLDINEKMWNEHKDEILDMLKERGYEYIIESDIPNRNSKGKIDELNRGRITVFLKDTTEYKVSKLPDSEMEKIKEKGLTGYCASISSYGYSNVYANTIRRIDECAELYKKIYNVDRIDPTDVYSGYGWAGPRRNAIVDVPKGDTPFNREPRANREFDRTREYTQLGDACMEKLAEAYSDVMLRQDDANSMSKLIYAHVQYELHQLMTGYEGTFEDFVRDKIGMDKFERLITKSLNTDVNQRFITEVRKSIQRQQTNTILEHQAFISTISAQFNKKMHR